MTDVPTVNHSVMKKDLQQLLEEADDFDLIHDVIIQVGTSNKQLFEEADTFTYSYQKLKARQYLLKY